MSAARSFVTDFTQAMARSGTAPKMRALVPVGESAPVMWSYDVSWEDNLARYTVALRGEDNLGSIGTRDSTLITDLETRYSYIRSGLGVVLAAVAAKTPTPTNLGTLKTRDVSAWGSFIATAGRIVFKKPATDSSTGIQEKAITPAVATFVRYLVDAMFSIAGGDRVDLNTAEFNLRLREITEALKLPAAGTLTSEEIVLLAGRDATRETAAYYAMVVLLAGKTITEQSDNAICVARPKNLYDKFNGGIPWATVGGSLQMSKGAYTAIMVTWSLNPTLRMSLLVPLVALEEGEAFVTGNIVFTMFKLLRGAGMSHVNIIKNFAARFPYADEIPELSSEFYLLYLHTRSYMTVPENIRPYFKLLYGDATSLFDSKLLIKLTGLAISVMATTENRMGQYAHKDDSDMRDKFNAIRAYYEGVQVSTTDQILPANIVAPE
jgi:hypothetical protein